MPVTLITDGFNISDQVTPALGGPKLTITYRPVTRLELLEHFKAMDVKKGQDIEREKIRFAFIASRLVSWDVDGGPPINADNVGRLPTGYLDPIEDLIAGYKVTDDEKKS